MPHANLSAFRHASWEGGGRGDEFIALVGEDLSLATFAWSFADKPGGEVLFTLKNAEAGAQGLSASYDGNYIHPRNGKVVGATIIVPQIDEATLRALPDPTEPSRDIVLTHTFYLTHEDGLKRAQFAGTFTIQQGAPN